LARELVFARSLFSAPLNIAKRFSIFFANVTRRQGNISLDLRYSLTFMLTITFMTPEPISVIIPTYNRPEMLRQALESLQAQTDPAWEAIVVDDGDGRGLDFVEQLGDKRIRALMNKGEGQVQARNTAIQAATGDIIAWLDDDDWWEDKEHIERVKKALETPALVHSYGYFVFTDKHNKRTPYELSATAESMRKDNTLLTSSIAYPRYFHDELGLLDPTVEGYFDWDWHLRVLDAGYPLHTVESKDVCYRLHSGGRSNEAASPQRLKGFEALKQKHTLEIQIKNHLMVLEENQGVHS
jgi:glycosyltransferase involved in cell wall biosynthesis